MSEYDALAASYDGLMADGAYRKRAAYLIRRFRSSGTAVETVLDLACGTGTIACLLAEAGYDIIASDASEEMLTQAARKAEALKGKRPLFVRQSMERLELPKPVDAVISTLDSLNYLTQKRALLGTFLRVYRALKPGGLFLFDVNTPCKFQRMDAQMYSDETEESFCVWRTFFSRRTGICTYQVDLFRLREDGLWERDYEEHRERAWSAEELETFLRQAGFSGIVRTGDLTDRPPEAEEDRWNYRCEKPKD